MFKHLCKKKKLCTDMNLNNIVSKKKSVLFLSEIIQNTFLSVILPDPFISVLLKAVFDTWAVRVFVSGVLMLCHCTGLSLFLFPPAWRMFVYTHQLWVATSSCYLFTDMISVKSLGLLPFPGSSLPFPSLTSASRVKMSPLWCPASEFSYKYFH